MLKVPALEMSLLLLLLMGVHVIDSQKTSDRRDDYFLSLVFGELSRMNNALTKLAKDVDLLKQRSGGKHCEVSKPRDCFDIMTAGLTSSGVYTVYVGSALRPTQVYCDMTTDGGGWTVFQRRQDGRVNFYQNWNNYASGFGNLTGEFWLGNDNLHWLTAGKNYRLRVDMEDWHGHRRHAEYAEFKVASACAKYKITFSDYCGNAGDSLTYNVGQKFSTWDQDNDIRKDNCAQITSGAWWFKDCYEAHLNAPYKRGGTTATWRGIIWYAWKGKDYSLKFTEMKIRPE